MSEYCYKKALKFGQKEYRACVAAGKYPYLPALDDFIPPVRSAAGSDQGLISVPAEFIVGTKTKGRTNAFACNFMPLLSETSEFAQKWEKLCQSHLEEGIRDPVKVYEYMNRYYVEEGNKRVSVLKFFGAVQIPAQVVRVMPEDSDTQEVLRYREFLRFCRISGVNFLEFSRSDGYKRFQKKAGKEVEESWSDAERRRLTTAYYTFRRAYEETIGFKLAAAPGDAMLAYLEVHSYDSLCASSPEDLKRAIEDMWEEFRLIGESSPIEVSMVPQEERKRPFLAKVFEGAKPTKIAFFYDRNPEVSEWAHGHEMGRQEVQKVFAGRVETAAYSDLLKGDAQAAIENAIQEGNTVLFTTSPRLLPASLQAAVCHPEVTFFNCSLNQSHRYIRTYYPRIYEAKFILGAIAAAMVEENEIGYICDYPIYGQIAGINAFALGAQMIRPRARVILEWSDVDGPVRARKKLAERGVRLISIQHLSKQRDGTFGPNGLTIENEDGGVRLLAAPKWNWNAYYREMIRRVLDGSIQDEYESSTKALNYYWGMSAGVVDIQCGPSLPEPVCRLAEALKQSICGEVCQPFALPIRKQGGESVGSPGESASLEEIMRMDYLVENVAGAIPAYNELSLGRETVEVMGIELPSEADTENPVIADECLEKKTARVQL